MVYGLDLNIDSIIAVFVLRSSSETRLFTGSKNNVSFEMSIFMILLGGHISLRFELKL